MRAFVCVGSGPSLTREDCEKVRDSGIPSIVVNTTYQMFPEADILYAMDSVWWRTYIDDVREKFKGRLICPFKNSYGVERWRFHFGKNSGFGAINLSVKLGAETVILLGYDCDAINGKRHWHGNHPGNLSNAGRLKQWAGDFQKIRTQYINVINCSRHTKLEHFRRMNLEDALCDLTLQETVK
jgi:hypothetical protein